MPRWLVWKHIEVPENPWTVEEIAHRAQVAALQLWARRGTRDRPSALDPIADRLTLPGSLPK